MRDTISKNGLTGISGRRAILVFVTGLGLAFGPMTRAGQSVTLAWNPSPSSSVVGYKVYCSTDGTNYNTQLDAGANTSWSVTGLQAGTTNYFEVSAYDAANNQSPPSNPVQFVVPAATNSVPVQGNPTTNTVATQGNSTNAGSGGSSSSSPASPPALAAVPHQSVKVGSPLLITNVVAETNVPSREITLASARARPPEPPFPPTAFSDGSPLPNKAAQPTLSPSGPWMTERRP